jgi:hypothetical protein
MKPPPLSDSYAANFKTLKKASDQPGLLLEVQDSWPGVHQLRLPRLRPAAHAPKHGGAQALQDLRRGMRDLPPLRQGDGLGEFQAWLRRQEDGTCLRLSMRQSGGACGTSSR